MNDETSALEQQYLRLMSDSSGSLSYADALTLAGALLDTAHDLRRQEGVERVISLLGSIPSSELTTLEEAYKCYILGDAFGDLDALQRMTGTPADFWETANQASRLFNLRIATRLLEPLPDAPAEYVCSALNNLGTALNATGRLIQGISAWNTALDRDAGFAMALGNRGCALVQYGESVHDDSHRYLLWIQALEDLRAALKAPLHPEPANGFQRYLSFIELRLSPTASKEIDWNALSLGRSKKERDYRTWCLTHRLFLHPLNDLGPFTMAAYDPVSVPDMIVTSQQEGDFYRGFFNELKQEFVSARYLLYESLLEGPLHFSDRDVVLADTLNGSIQSLRSQKQRLAFRAAYSLFDKLAFFLNSYLELGIPERRVKFRTLWYVKQDAKCGLLPELLSSENTWLRALFAVSLDIIDNHEGFTETSEPDATATSVIRNHAEHKFLALVTHLPKDLTRLLPPSEGPRPFSLTQDGFVSRAIRVLQTAREALMYLSLMIGTRERQKTEDADPDTVFVPVPWQELKRSRRI